MSLATSLALLAIVLALITLAWLSWCQTRIEKLEAELRTTAPVNITVPASRSTWLTPDEVREISSRQAAFNDQKLAKNIRDIAPKPKSTSDFGAIADHDPADEVFLFTRRADGTMTVACVPPEPELVPFAPFGMLGPRGHIFDPITATFSPPPQRPPFSADGLSPS